MLNSNPHQLIACRIKSAPKFDRAYSDLTDAFRFILPHRLISTHSYLGHHRLLGSCHRFSCILTLFTYSGFWESEISYGNEELPDKDIFPQICVNLKKICLAFFLCARKIFLNFVEITFILIQPSALAEGQINMFIMNTQLVLDVGKLSYSSPGSWLCLDLKHARDMIRSKNSTWTWIELPPCAS